MVSPPDENTDKPRRLGLLEVGQLLGLLAGLTTLVYVSGAAVLWTRLSHKHLPPEGVIPSLPRQLPITIGLTEVVLPLLVAGSIITTALFVAVKTTHLEALACALDDWPDSSSIERALLVAGILVTFVGGEVLAWLVGGPDLLNCFLVLVTVAVFWGVGRALRIHFKGKLESFAAVVSTGALFVFTLTPWLVAAAQRRHPLLQATVCLTDAPPLTVSLISEAGDRIYVGVIADTTPSLGSPAEPGSAGKPADGSRGPAIAVIPRSRVQALLIGGSFKCDAVARPTTGLTTR